MTNVISHVPDAPRHDVIPDSATRFGPKNWPVHIYPEDWKAGENAKTSSPTGVSMGVLTVRNEEHAALLTKELFAKGLIAEA